MSYNKIDRKILQQSIQKDTTPRKVLSFYKYISIANLSQLQNTLYKEFTEKFSILGRIYLATEGINAQISIPEHLYSSFVPYLTKNPHISLGNIFLNQAIEHKNHSFYKLTIKIKNQIVADNLDTKEYNITNTGKHINGKQFNQLLTEKDTLIIDVRNFFESEIGHFQNAILPNCETFRETLPVIKEKFQDQKNNKIALYCTGGIRCEKASAYLKSNGFKNVFQLKGGIISYIHQIQSQKIQNFFKGKNFVFDQRLGEQVSNDIISSCHQCQVPCDTHSNCANTKCHTLFIQCLNCKKEYHGYCSIECLHSTESSLSLQERVPKVPQINQKNIRETNKYRAPHIKKII